MEDLLRFITANPFFLIVIIGAIYSFLTKGKETKKDTGKQGQPAQKKASEVDWRDIFRQEAEIEPKSKKQTHTIEELNTHSSSVELARTQELLEKYEKVKKDRQTGKKTERTVKNSPIFQDDITAQKRVKLDFSSISREDVINGVVWSEILGKPRAKGSYRPSIYSRRKQG